MAQQSNLRVAILATDGFEEAEMHDPLRALREAKLPVDIIAPHRGQLQGFQHFEKGAHAPVDRTFDEAHAEEYDAVMLPGGTLNADALRVVPEAQVFVRQMQEAGKPMAFICHAAWLLVSTNLVRGRRLTSYHTIQDDIRNAGGIWLDQEVVEDRNWVSSRSPKDLPAFNAAMMRLFQHQPVMAQH